jgi:transposase
VDQTPDPRDARIAELEQSLRTALALIAELKAEVAELKAKLGQNSRNSSKPPSSDSPEVPRPTQKPSEKRRGGQPRHKGAERQLLEPDRIVDYKPKECRKCACRLAGDDANPSRFQVFELPEIRPDVTEHRAHTLTCPDCATRTSAVIPANILLHGFGPWLTAFAAFLTGRCRLSKRQVVEVFDEAFSTPISVGGVCGLEKDVSAALAVPFEEAAAAIQTQPIVHADETSWPTDKKKAWLWVAVTGIAIVFRVARSRGAVVARELLGEQFAGRLVTDRWSAYNWVETLRRQLCWAHLFRDFQGMVDRGGVGGVLATQVLAEADKMMDWWHRVREKQLERAEFQRLMVPVKAAVARLLREAASCAESKTAGMCKEMLKLEPALWTFVDVEGLEPTNNSGERAIRPAVLWRKGSFGNDSTDGARFTERILTAVATLRLRRRSVLAYLADACASYRANRTAPSLLSVAAVE